MDGVSDDGKSFKSGPKVMTADGISDDGKSFRSGAKVEAKSEEMSVPSEPAETPPEKELLLCLRPIRDGEAKKIEGKLGFGGVCKKKLHPTSPTRSESTKPPKKRRQDDSPSEEPSPKKAPPVPEEGLAVNVKDNYTEVVESLIVMNQQASV